MLGQVKVNANNQHKTADIGHLINATTDMTDTDGDGLPDSVEKVIGTDFNNTDSDFDQLNDYDEIFVYGSDPLDQDSNGDGLIDYHEVMDVFSLDVDGDGFPNIWDLDNDNDGIDDKVDSSPFSHSDTFDKFNFNLKTNGNPTYMEFQIRPQNPENVRLAFQEWDWPWDNESIMRDLDNSKKDLQAIPMLVLELSSAPNESDVGDYGIFIDSNKAFIPLNLVQGLGGPVALGGKMFFPSSLPLDIQGSASLLWMVMAKTDKMVNGSLQIDNTSIIKYNENFTITGLGVEESYGTDVGLFYSENLNQTMGANILMSYSFLRNNQSTLYDLPGDLADHNLTMNSTIRSFSHRDLAMLNLTTDMTPDALGSLPDGHILPIISGFETNFSRKDLSDLGSGSYMIGNDAILDLQSQDSMILKVQKTSWYNTSSQETISLEESLDQINNWGTSLGLDNDGLASIMALFITWYVGESKITRIGDRDIDFGAQEAIRVGDFITTGFGIAAVSVSALNDIIGLITEGVYRFTYAIHYVLKGVLDVHKALAAVTQGLSVSDKLIKAVSILGKIVKVGEGLGKALAVIGVVLVVIGWVVEVGFAIWGFFSIWMSSGWTAMGALQGGVYATIMIIYATVMAGIAIALIAIGFIPVWGWIVALIGGIILGLIALTDFILGLFGIGFSNLVQWFVSLFHKTWIKTQVDLSIIDTNLEIDDLERNGISVGDRITLRSLMNGTILKTSDGTWQDVEDSYIIPYYKINESYMRNWVADFGHSTDIVKVTDFSSGRNTTYNVSAWIEPRAGNINFPTPIIMEGEYMTLYGEMHWFKTYHKYTTGTFSNIVNTLYFDVFPADINSFSSWRQIASLDNDRDGISNSDDICPWNWDCDGDGLSDGYEKQSGTDPRDPDMDKDGLNDRMEIYQGTNLTNADMDGDGLSDYLEITGWQMSVLYNNIVFNWSVDSEPTLRDTDGDGLDDQLEFWGKLNPRSVDSDGDGQDDTPFVKLIGTFNDSLENLSRPGGIAIADDIIFIANSNTSRIMKFHPNGTFISSWGINGSENGSFYEPKGIAIDSSGLIYIADTFNNRIQKFTYNGTFISSWGSDGSGNGSFNMPYGIAIDINDQVYVADTDNDRIQKFHSNGTFIASWGTYGSGNGSFDKPHGIAVDGMDNVFVADTNNNRIQKFTSNGTFQESWPGNSANYIFHRPKGISIDSVGRIFVADTSNSTIKMLSKYGDLIGTWGTNGTDADQFYGPEGAMPFGKGFVFIADTMNHRVQIYSLNRELEYWDASDLDNDGLNNNLEERGWPVIFTNSTGIHNIHVSSMPYIKDTDSDGVIDILEFNLSINPRNIDTDYDGLTDFTELTLGTNIAHFDTDFDQLDDGKEITFGSNPLDPDSDDDTLSDFMEYSLGSNPMSNDTDGDGLYDGTEALFTSSLLFPDSDNDMLTDNLEFKLGGNPWKNDTDNDGLLDGAEFNYNTNVSYFDTDYDRVDDKFEIDNWMNPLKNDTDGDGIDDYTELKYGTDPLNWNDKLNPHSYTRVDEIWVAYDSNSETENFIKKLSNLTNVTIFQAHELENYSHYPNILLVGRPKEENNTAGGLIADIMGDRNPEALDRMNRSDQDRFFLDYNIWRDRQTVVMLSNPYRLDHFRVLDSFKSVNKTIKYPFPVDTIMADAAKEMDSMVWIELEKPVKPTFEMKLFNQTTLSNVSFFGFGRGRPLGKYLEIKVSDNVQKSHSDNIIAFSYIIMLYTASDLDRNGDGDADDPGDLKEGPLRLMWYNESSGSWIKLRKGLDWVYDVGVNTTDINISGKEYLGYVWANVSHLSLYGLLIDGSESDNPGGVTDHELAISRVEIPPKIQPGNSYPLKVIISSASAESGAVLTYKKKPGGWAGKEVDTGPMFVGLNEIQIQLEVPGDAQVGRYELILELTPRDFLKKISHSFWIDVEEEESEFEPEEPITPESEKEEIKDEEILISEDRIKTPEGSIREEKTAEADSSAPLPVIPIVLIVSLLFVAGAYYIRRGGK